MYNLLENYICKLKIKLLNLNYKNMTKADIVADIAEETGLERVEALKAVEAFMTSVKSSPIWKNENWTAKASALDEEEIRYEFVVPTRTLDSILESLNVATVDFFSLDVEGYELEVLKGFSIEKYLPKVLLVEWHDDIQKIIDVVDNTHKFIEKLSLHDYVFTLR
jgi:FkbM family methyltransferase